MLGALVGVLVVLIGVLLLSYQVHSVNDPRATVTAIVRQELALSRSKTAAAPKDDGGVGVYIMSPPPSQSPPVPGPPVYPASPGPGHPDAGHPPAPVPADSGPGVSGVAPVQSGDLSKLQVVEVSARLAEVTASGPRQEWTLTVRNADTVAHTFAAFIRFRNRSGAMTHSCHVRNLSAPAGATVTYEGSLIASQPPATVTAELIPNSLP